MRSVVSAGLAGALSIIVAVPASAEMITVHPPTVCHELDHEEILEAIYAGDFIAGGPDYLGGGALGNLSAIRYDDFMTGAGVLDVVTGAFGSAADERWTDGFVELTATARYAVYSQQFGLDRGDGFEHLFDLTGYGTAVSGGAAVDLTGDTWCWVRRDVDGSNAFYSQTARNRDELDHMVTYRIHGLEDVGATWLLFWEDLTGAYGMGSDRDFNDLVVEVRAIPEPATLVLFGIGGLALVQSVRRRRG